MMLAWLSGRPEYLIVLAAALSGAGAIVGGYGAFKLQQRQIAAANARAVFERDMRLQTAEAIRQITGGDNYCYAKLGDPVDRRLSAILGNDGEYTCYDVAIRVED